eukprot:1155602-Pelagomonas_calceolata.AAC.8
MSVSCTFRWLGKVLEFFRPRPKMGPIMLSHRDYLNPTTCRTILLDNIGEGMRSIGGPAATGCARNG